MADDIDVDALIKELREFATAAKREGMSLTANRYLRSADALVKLRDERDEAVKASESNLAVVDRVREVVESAPATPVPGGSSPLDILADALNDASLTPELAGRIVAASFEDGRAGAYCGLDACECPDHEGPAPKPGTYVTVRLDDPGTAIGFWNVTMRPRHRPSAKESDGDES